MDKPTCYFLVGVPGSGKSTWMEPVLHKFPDTVLVSSDQYIERAAAKVGKTYGDVFQQEIKSATTKMHMALDQAVRNRKDIIWDQTNLTAEGRRKKIARLKDYHIVAVCFEIAADELVQRHEKRRNETGKDVPIHIVNHMLAQYQRPQLSEGFDEIRVVTG